MNGLSIRSPHVRITTPVTYERRLVRGGIAVVLVSVLGWLGGCLDNPNGPVDRLPPRGLIVSDPVSSAGIGAVAFRATPTGNTGDDVAYVCLPPGTVPSGTTATIGRVGFAGSIAATMFDGGFDPIPVGAAPGDSIEIVVADAAGSTVFQAALAVAARRPPVVVRTNPPRKKADVPLNTTIVIVFSEPIAGGTVNGSTIRLVSDGHEVAGQLVLAVDRLRVEFRPDRPLAARKDYTLEVATGVSDLDGDRLEQAVTVDFATESAQALVDSVAVSPPTLTVTPGEALQLTATAYDSARSVLTGRVVMWSNADTTIAAVSTTGVVTGVAIGSTTVTATTEGRSAAATIKVVRPLVFSSVSVGYSHTCGITTAGVAYCWGDNFRGQLGDGSTAPKGTPVAVAGGLTFASLSAGWYHTCGLTTAGAAYCWGGNSYGGLGDGSTSSSTTPLAVAGGHTFVEVSAGWSGWGGEHTCALTAAGAAYCWGDGRLGQLGNGRGNTDADGYQGSLTPAPVSGGLTFKSLSAGWESTCGLASDGSAYCWGTSEQLGAAQSAGAPHEQCVVSNQPDFYETCSLQPVPVAPGLTFASLSSGMYTACGVTGGGTASCWGYAAENGNPNPRGNSAPIVVPGGVAFAAVSAGKNQGFTCGVTGAGAAYCWGTVPNDGGENWVGTGWVSAPRAVPGGITFASVGAGAYHACGITPNGQVYCWGFNHDGQLGNGGLDAFYPIPVKVAAQP